MKTRIAQNLAHIRQRMEHAAQRVGRTLDDILLIPVTKSVGLPEVEILHQLGIQQFAENRPEVARDKIAGLGPGPLWHMIGNIQRRKARDIVALFDYVDAVDRLELAETLQRRCEELQKQIPILIEINVSGESSKHGFNPHDLPAALQQCAHFDRLQVRGLMTMAPFDADPHLIRSIFRTLHRLALEHGLPECSMGMTDDFEIAIEEGATQIRIGRALFE